MYTHMRSMAAATAIVGGLVLTLLVLMTVASIGGRALIFAGLAPIPGDYELVEIGIGFAIFCFLPICQLNAAHATVDVFTSLMGPRVNRLLLVVWEIVFFAALVVIAWRLYDGMLGKLKNGETTVFLRIPLWSAYGICLPPAIIAAVVCGWSVYDRMRALMTGRDTRPIAAGAEH